MIAIAYMGIWCSSLELNGNSSEQQNLDSSSSSIPKGSRNAWKTISFSSASITSFIAYHSEMRQKNFAIA